MERPQPVKSRLYIIAALALTAAVGIARTGLAEPPAGSRNFSAPPVAPNYFSNESGPVMRQQTPLPVAPPPAMRVAPETEEPELRAEAAPKAERRVVTAARSRDRHRGAHAQSRTADRRKIVAVSGRSAKPARVAARNEKPRVARLAHAEPHAAKARPVSAKGQRAGRG
jgi:hypothetical protein